MATLSCAYFQKVEVSCRFDVYQAVLAFMETKPSMGAEETVSTCIYRINISLHAQPRHALSTNLLIYSFSVMCKNVSETFVGKACT